MPAFQWTGRDTAGTEVRGVSEGASAAAIADELFTRGITPLDIRAGGRMATSGKAITFDLGQYFKPQVTHADVLLFSRQIYSLLKAGVPIMRALAGLQESATSPAMREVIGDLRDSLDSGRELSAALARHPKVFPPFYLSMIRVGEMTGMLDEVFLRLSQHMDFERFMREQVRSALRYPSFVVAAMVAAIIVVNIWVIPAFAKVFQSMQAQLPLMTRLLIGFSDFMVAWWPALLVGAAGSFFAFRAWTGTTAGRLTWDRLKLRIPIAGRIVQKATLARFARSFALATRSGVPVIQALSNVGLTMDNTYMTARIEAMRQAVERGESVLRAAIGTRIFTPVVLQMIAVGEESGSLDDMMQEIAEMYQREVEYELKTLSQQIEPILIVFLGLMVLVLALGIFVPMWDMGKVSMGKK